ncbi:MAG TPA: cytochrome c oxidase subunit II, partial [Polyangiaceae bacterium]
MLGRMFFADLQPKSPPSPMFSLPKAGSTGAADTDTLYSVLVGLSAVFAFGIFLAIAYFIWKYKAGSRSDNEIPEKTADHNTALELTWSVLPLVLVMGIFVWGFRGYLDLRTPPKDAYDVQVTGQKWNWTFTYSNGLSDNTLHVPLDTPVRLVLSSVDVIHSLYIPAFRAKMDAVPGRFTELWFNATEPGEYPIFCAEYCGTGHSAMLSRVIVHPSGGYEAWLTEQSKKLTDMPLPDLGKQLYEKQGCKTCHSVDGSPLIGPSWKGLFGRESKMSDGQAIKADENYIRESITEPQKRIVQGFTPAMPTYQGKLSDREL